MWIVAGHDVHNFETTNLICSSFHKVRLFSQTIMIRESSGLWNYCSVQYHDHKVN